MGIDKGWGNKGGLMPSKYFLDIKNAWFAILAHAFFYVFLWYFEYLWSKPSFVLLLLIFFVIVVKVL